MSQVNAQLEASGADYRLGVVEAYTGADEQGITVFFNNRGNKQLDHDFVPGDPRRPWSGPPGPGDDITWTTDTTQGDAGPGLGPTQLAISNSMATWQNTACSNLPLNFLAIPGIDMGVVEFIFSGGASGSPFIFADVTQAGFGTIVDLFFLPSVIAVTFTFIFIDGGGNPTDIDANGKADAAFREVYYTSNFVWGINANVDVETVALHENGHSLSQGHFGRLIRTDKNGKFHFNPKAVMNAGYTGVQQSLTGTDNGGHCSIWDDWPNS